MATWILKQWPVPLVVATALIVMLAVQQFGVTVGSAAHLPQTRSDAKVAKLEGTGCDSSSAATTARGSW